ncbi:aldose epimerase family protein [Microvirga sp. 2TAF3]|uniref:aldose epimerase family protein n=1 Tax=Microvirga sp. 2TAF3 TaxID=3233014 RepID=UPI003F967967
MHGGFKGYASSRGVSCGVSYGKHAGFSLETQVYPNSPNVPHFPSAVLRPGKIYRHAMRVPFFTL